MTKVPKKVSFIANKKVTQPQVVNFNTKDGMVIFTAKKKISRPQVVTFQTNQKKKK